MRPASSSRAVRSSRSGPGAATCAAAMRAPRMAGVWLYDVHISPYEQSGTYFNHEPTRPRRLLLHRREISRIVGQIERQGYTLVHAPSLPEGSAGKA